MARDETRVLGLSVLRNDAEALAATQNMEGYKSSVPEFKLAKLEKAEAELRKADALFAQTEAAWQSARDARVAAQWTFHNAILGTKRQVLASTDRRLLAPLQGADHIPAGFRGCRSPTRSTPGYRLARLQRASGLPARPVGTGRSPTQSAFRPESTVASSARAGC